MAGYATEIEEERAEAHAEGYIEGYTESSFCYFCKRIVEEMSHKFNVSEAEVLDVIENSGLFCNNKIIQYYISKSQEL